MAGITAALGGMTMGARFALLASLALAACSPGESEQAAGSEPVAWTMADATVFPADKSLARAEDGVILADGRLIVADQRFGLVELAQDGTHKPFGQFAQAGYVDDPDGMRAGPNGVHLTADGQHILTADVYTGAIWRTDVASGTTVKAYQHGATVNTAIKDSTGAIWFTQSTGAIGEPGMLAGIDKSLKDGALLRLALLPDGSYAAEPELMVEGLDFANGFHIDERGGRLFLSETLANRVLAFTLDPATGKLSERKVLAEIPTPDNMRMDADGMLWVASPIANRVMVVDPATGKVRVGFDAQPADGAKVIAEWNRRGDAGESRLELMATGGNPALPGLLTGLVMTPEGRPAYISNLGNALVRLEQ